MKIPLYIQECFKAFDNINGNGIIEQEEIDALKGTGTIYDVNKSKYFSVKAGMDLSVFIQDNRYKFGSVVQFTDNEYTQGRKTIQKDTLKPTHKKRKLTCDDKKSIQVEQGEFALKTYSEDAPSLQTYNVCNCVAISIYDKETKKGFLAHIDTVSRADSLEKVLQNCNFNPETSEVRIIGGHTEASEGLIEIIDETVKKFSLKVVEYDLLGNNKRRDIQLDLNTGELFDYNESKPTYDMSLVEENKRLILSPSEKSDKEG